MVHNGQDSWTLTRQGVDAASEDYAYIANAYLGLRVPPWGNGVGTTDSRCLISGLHYGSAANTHLWESTSTFPRQLRLPIVDRLDARDDSGRSLLLEVPGADVCQDLRLQTGEIHTRIEHGDALIQQTIFCNQKRRNLIQQRLRLTAKRPLNVVFDGKIVMTSAAGFAAPLRQTVAGEGLMALAGTTQSTAVAVGLAVCLAVQADGLTPVFEGPVTVRLTIPAGQTVTVWKGIAVFDSREQDDPAAAAADAARELEIWKFEKDLQEHREAWQLRWEHRVEVDDSRWARMLNIAQYNLKSSHDSRNPWSIPPLGLSGYAWNGFVFPWDATLWMFPYFLVTDSAAAKRLLEYELEGGVWGNKRIEYYASGRANKMYEAGCVALAAWQFYLSTRDTAWLLATGIRLVEAACQGYARRAIFNEDLEQFEIRNVWPPDENAGQDSDNSVFTNALAEKVVSIYAAILARAGRPVPSWLHPLLTKGFWLPFDESGQHHIEHARWRRGEIADAYAGTAIKQADVSLIRFPLERKLPAEVIRNDLDYYVSRLIEDGPEMNWGILAVIAAELGDEARMMDYLEKIPRHLHTPYLSFHESPTNSVSVFATGSGDLLQGFIFGCCGLRWRENGTFLRPFVPRRLGTCRIHGLYMDGSCYDLEVAHRHVTRLQRRTVRG